MSEALVIPTTDPNIILRRMTTLDEDIAFFESVESSREHLRGVSTATKYQTLEDVTGARLEAGGQLRMAIWLREKRDDTFVGYVQGTPRDEPGIAEIGFFVDSRHTGKGYAALGARALALYMSSQGFEVFAQALPENSASIRSLQNAGFRQTARPGAAARQEGLLVFDFVYPEAAVSQ